MLVCLGRKATAGIAEIFIGELELSLFPFRFAWPFYDSIES
jgi:hypothetical protein